MPKRVQMPKPGRGPGSKKTSARQPARSPWLLLAVIGAVVVMAAGLIVLAVQSARKPVEATGQAGAGTAWGPIGAPVTILEFSDFNCSHCRDFALNQGRQLRAEYESTGKVRFEFKNFVLDWQSTAAAANAALCAADQGRFWDYHDTLYRQQGLSAQAFGKAALKDYAVQLGLDAAAFGRCVDTDQHAEALARERSEGTGRGVSATPTFFISEQRIAGAVPYSQFKAAVDAALVAAQE